jgi:hypothetical protein
VLALATAARDVGPSRARPWFAVEIFHKLLARCQNALLGRGRDDVKVLDELCRRVDATVTALAAERQRTGPATLVNSSVLSRSP